MWSRLWLVDIAVINSNSNGKLTRTYSAMCVSHVYMYVHLSLLATLAFCVKAQIFPSIQGPICLIYFLSLPTNVISDANVCLISPSWICACSGYCLHGLLSCAWTRLAWSLHIDLSPPGSLLTVQLGDLLHLAEKILKKYLLNAASNNGSERTKPATRFQFGRHLWVLCCGSHVLRLSICLTCDLVRRFRPSKGVANITRRAGEFAQLKFFCGPSLICWNQRRISLVLKKKPNFSGLILFSLRWWKKETDNPKRERERERQCYCSRKGCSIHPINSDGHKYFPSQPQASVKKF